MDFESQCRIDPLTTLRLQVVIDDVVALFKHWFWQRRRLVVVVLSCCWQPMAPAKAKAKSSRAEKKAPDPPAVKSVGLIQSQATL